MGLSLKLLDLAQQSTTNENTPIKRIRRHKHKHNKRKKTIDTGANICTNFAEKSMIPTIPTPATTNVKNIRSTSESVQFQKSSHKSDTHSKSHFTSKNSTLNKNQQRIPTNSPKCSQPLNMPDLSRFISNIVQKCVAKQHKVAQKGEGRGQDESDLSDASEQSYSPKSETESEVQSNSDSASEHSDDRNDQNRWDGNRQSSSISDSYKQKQSYKQNSYKQKQSDEFESESEASNEPQATDDDDDDDENDLYTYLPKVQNDTLNEEPPQGKSTITKSFILILNEIFSIEST